MATNVYDLIAGVPPQRPQFHTGPAYKLGAANVPTCQGCGGTHWLVGRLLAECANCATAVPITD